MKTAATCMAAALMAFSFNARAQETGALPEAAEQPADCRAAPADQPGGEGVMLPEESRLEDCGPVLKPPVSADSEIAVPPVQGGETPVIPPSQVPHTEGGTQ